MNISSNKYNSASLYNNRNINNNNQNISFNGGKCIRGKSLGSKSLDSKSAFAEKLADKAGCAANLLLFMALLPITLTTILLQNTKKNKIDSLTRMIESQYKTHVPMEDIFEKCINDLNALLDKYSKNKDYSQFVKDALDFLHLNFKQNYACAKEYARLKPFKDANGSDLNWYIFMQTINDSAKTAISKTGKGIDKETLDKNIQICREIMQNATNNGQ